MNKPSSADSTPSETAAASSPTVEIYDRLDRLEAIADAWDDLVLTTGQSPLLSWAWVASHLECCLPATQPWRCFAAFENDCLIGVLPLLPHPVSVAGQHRTILRPPRDPHMPVTGPVCQAGREAAVIPALLAAAERAYPDLLGIEFAQVTAGSALGSLGQPRIGDVSNLRNPAGFASFLPTVGKFDELFRSTSSNFRKRLKKDRKKLNELPDISFEIYSGREASPDMLERFTTVEAAGWKGRGGSAIGTSDQLMQFYRMLVRRLYRRGCLEWQFLSTAGQTIAGHMAVRSGQTLTLWKIGYDEEFSRCSPGVMLFEKAVQNAFERDDIDGFDLVSDKDWHDNWRAEKRPYLDIWLYPRRPLSLLFGVLPKKTRWALRRVPGLQSFVRRLQSGRGEH